MCVLNYHLEDHISVVIVPIYWNSEASIASVSFYIGSTASMFDLILTCRLFGSWFILFSLYRLDLF